MAKKRKKLTTASSYNLKLPFGTYMITLNSIKINKNRIKSLKELENMVNLPLIVCPHCNSTQIIKYGTYKRLVIFLIDGAIHNKEVKVQRTKCKSCGKTHALLPSFIIPYKQYSVDLIAQILLDLETETYETVSNRYNINVRYIASLKRQYETKHKSRCKTTFNNLTYDEVFRKIIDGSNNCIERFIKINNFNFMQNRLTPVAICNF